MFGQTSDLPGNQGAQKSSRNLEAGPTVKTDLLDKKVVRASIKLPFNMHV